MASSAAVSAPASAVRTMRFSVSRRALLARMCPPLPFAGCGASVHARSARQRALKFVHDHRRVSSRVRLVPHKSDASSVGIAWVRSLSFRIGLVPLSRASSVNAAGYRGAFLNAWKSARAPHASATAALAPPPAALQWAESAVSSSTTAGGGRSSFFDPLPEHVARAAAVAANAAGAVAAPTPSTASLAAAHACWPTTAAFNVFAAPSAPDVDVLRFGGVLERRAPPFVYSLRNATLSTWPLGSISVLHHTLGKRLRRLLPHVLLRHAPAIAGLAVALDASRGSVGARAIVSPPPLGSATPPPPPPLEFILQPTVAALLMPDAELVLELDNAVRGIMAEALNRSIVGGGNGGGSGTQGDGVRTQVRASMAVAAAEWHALTRDVRALPLARHFSRTHLSLLELPSIRAGRFAGGGDGGYGGGGGSHRGSRSACDGGDDAAGDESPIAAALLARALHSGGGADAVQQMHTALGALHACIAAHPVYARFLASHAPPLQAHRVPLLLHLSRARPRAFSCVPPALLKTLVGTDTVAQLSRVSASFARLAAEHAAEVRKQR